jgi:hypothetical protein
MHVFNWFWISVTQNAALTQLYCVEYWNETAVSSTSLPRCQGRCAGKFSLNLNCGKRLRFADLSEGSRRSSGCVLVWVRHRLAVWPRFGLVTSPVGASPTVAVISAVSKKVTSLARGKCKLMLQQMLQPVL